MSIYICGACEAGKSKVTEEISDSFPDLELVLDPSIALFSAVFKGRSLGRILRCEEWEGHLEESYGILINLIEIYEREDIITNEGPLMLLSHLMFFGILHSFNDQQRKEILTRCYALLSTGTHFIVQRWVDSGDFCEASTKLQIGFKFGRANVSVIPKAENYETTVAQAVEFIKDKMEVE